MKEEKDRESSIQSDEHLLERAKDGYKPAFDIFYQRHKRVILNYVYRMVGSRDRAEDMAQEVFVKAYVSLQRYRSEGKALNWVYTIASNLCKNEIRAGRLRRSVSLDKELKGAEGLTFGDVVPSGTTTPREDAMNRESALILQGEIEKLPVKYRDVIVLCDIQGHSYEDAASILRCRVGSVGSRLSKARLILAAKLKRYFNKR